jgi:D-inositol-3-phosphate glycosyltransferase
MKVWIIDPAAMTPYYDISLTCALQAAGIEARLISSRFIYEAEISRAEQCTDFLFFRPLAWHSKTLKRTPWLRRAIRLAVYPFDLARLWRKFRRTSPHVVHIQWTWLPALDRGFFKLMAAHAPLVLTVHDTLPREAALTNMADMRPLYDLATRLIVHAEENRQALLTRTTISPERVSVIPLGPSFEEQPVVPREIARKALGLDIDSKVVLFFGIIKPYKGLLDLINAMALLCESIPPVHLLIAGKPEGSVEPYLNALAEHGLEGSATVYPEFIPSERVPTFFAASDVVCLPYREASQSAVLLTAYRFGKPVVVTDVGGLPESVEQGGNGYIVPSANPPALAAALGKLLGDRPMRERFGARSRALAEMRFSWERAAALTVEVYGEVIAEFAAMKGHE